MPSARDNDFPPLSVASLYIVFVMIQDGTAGRSRPGTSGARAPGGASILRRPPGARPPPPQGAPQVVDLVDDDDDDDGLQVGTGQMIWPFEICVQGGPSGLYTMFC